MCIRDRRYPDYEVNRLIGNCGQKLAEINKVMFQENPYINDILDENVTRCLDWEEFYNARVFIKSLTYTERCYFCLLYTA